MSTPFLVGFAETVVDRLTADHLVEIAAGGRGPTVLFVAEFLATTAQGGSLITGLEQALLACPHVEELYADLDRLKGLVDDLQAVRRGLPSHP